MYHWRVFLWQNGRKSTEYTDYLTAPIFIEDRLDETLDTGEIVLKSMLIETKTAFPPKTKIRLERYLTESYTDTPKTWDMVVDHDDVEEYEGCADICTHRISLIEASVIAQGMHVDNIALTYELQDVTLNYKTVVGKSDTLADKGVITVANNGYHTPIHSNPQIRIPEGSQSATYTFENSYNYVWQNTDTLKKLLFEQDGREARSIAFTIPTLTAQGCYSTGTWRGLFEMQTQTKVYERLRNKDGTILSEKTIIERICGPVSFDGIRNDEVYAIAKQTTIGSGGSSGDLPLVAHGTQINDYDNNDTGLLVSIKKQFSDLYNTNSGVNISTENPSAQSKSVTFSTSVLTEAQLNAGMYYEYEVSCTRYPLYQASTPLPVYYSRACYVLNNSYGLHQNMLTPSTQSVDASTIYINAKFRITDLLTTVDGDPFLASAKEYNCYDLIRKAMLTCDTQIFDNNAVGLDTIQYAIDIPAAVAAKLQAQAMHETIFEQKNLWEVLLQCGYYLHAIPHLEFAIDGTDRFMLSFRQLGDTRKKDDTSNKITVFNSRNLSEFFTQYDSYVTNLFSPQNVIDEWGVVKTSDSNYLVSNSTAEMRVKYPIQEIIEFDLTYGSATKSAIDMIFEESIYSILTPRTDIRPSKACALCYKLGDTKISGLNYTPPSVSAGDEPHALKTILSALFDIDAKGDVRFNDVKFHVKYRTQDSLRISQVRPDLQNFMKNSAYEKYPHHEQYFGQQDKIIDSERFTANLFGKLIRVGNAVYQRQECAEAESEKESGDLVTINGDDYYVTAIENEYYPDAILQKVTYSKNFNQLANIVTIPSEPRFYEVSERSQVRREIRLMDFLLLTTKLNTTAAKPTFMNGSTWRSIIRSILFADGSVALPNFAYTRFKADKKRAHGGIPTGKLFPSSEVTRTSDNSVKPKDSSDHRDVIVPLLHFPLKNAIVFEWDMDDNFKAGDSIDTTIRGKNNTTDEEYFSMQSVRYCDVMGRADLFSFRLFNKTNWTLAQARRLPYAESSDFIPSESASSFYISDSLSVGLDKDNREALSFNYQINLLQENSEFITYSNLFGQKNSKLKMCLLNTVASLFDDGVDITQRSIVADNVNYSLVNTDKEAIEIRITQPSGIDMNAVKSVVLYEQDGASKYAYIAKNVSKTANGQKLQSWYVYPIFTQ